MPSATSQPNTSERLSLWCGAVRGSRVLDMRQSVRAPEGAAQRNVEKAILAFPTRRSGTRPDRLRPSIRRLLMGGRYLPVSPVLFHNRWLGSVKTSGGAFLVARSTVT